MKQWLSSLPIMVMEQVGIQKTSKWFPYDEALKVPFLIYSPRQTKQGIDDLHLVSGVDVMSTVCDYAGIPEPPNMRGSSLRPVIEGDLKVEWRDHIYAEFMVTGRVIRTKKYKFVKYYKKSNLKNTDDKPFVRKDNGEASQFIPGQGDLFVDVSPRLLFDMEKDLWETENLAILPEYKDIVEQHEKLLKEWEETLIPGTRFDRN